MAITEEQRTTRQKYLGSSEVAALFVDDEGKSLNPFATAYDVFVEKYYGTTKELKSDAITIGNRYESALIEFAEEELGCKIETHPEKLEFIARDVLDTNGEPFNMSHPDGYTIGVHTFASDVFTNPSGIEVKTTSLVGEWGEDGSDQVPFRVILQAHHQMLCTGWSRVFVPVLLGKFGIREELFLIERDPRIIDAIITRTKQFWNDHVLTGIPPKKVLPGDIEIYKHIPRVPNKYADIDTKLIDDWETAKAAAKEAETAKKNAQFRMLEALRDAEAAVYDAERELTYFEQSRSGIDTNLLKERYPEVFVEVSKKNTFRKALMRKRNR